MASFGAEMETIESSELDNATWTFRHVGGTINSTEFRFLQNGAIGGYTHPNESAWRCRDGLLELLNEDGSVSSRFSGIERADGLLTRMTGSFLLDPNLDVAFALERNNPRLERTLPTGSKAHLAQQIRDFGWEIGEHSYGLPLVYAVDGNNKLKIGRFCSIGQAVTIVLVNHRSDFVSTYPFSTYRHVWPSAPILEDYVGKGDVIIGNDVWIGHGVFIASGVKIGDGAIIGGQSVVTKDVPAYAVVAGNPSRILRYRFPMPIIEELLEIKWWYWPDDRLERSLPFMMSGDVRAFVEHARGS